MKTQHIIFICLAQSKVKSFLLMSIYIWYYDFSLRNLLTTFYMNCLYSSFIGIIYMILQMFIIYQFVKLYYYQVYKMYWRKLSRVQLCLQVQCYIKCYSNKKYVARTCNSCRVSDFHSVFCSFRFVFKCYLIAFLTY